MVGIIDDSIVASPKQRNSRKQADKEWGNSRRLESEKTCNITSLELQELNSSSHTGERAIRKTYCYAGSGASGSSLPSASCGDGSSVKNLGYCNDGGGDNHIGQMCGDGGQTFGASGAPECVAGNGADDTPHPELTCNIGTNP